MLKQIFKKCIPATFYKVESANKLLLRELKQLFSTINKKILHIETACNTLSAQIGEQKKAI